MNQFRVGEEVTEVIRRKSDKNTAPGRDGVGIRVLRCLPELGLRDITDCYNRCLAEGKFPEVWKRALLVLIPKGWPMLRDLNSDRSVC